MKNFSLLCAFAILATGCSNKNAPSDARPTPVFKLAWSEYPSWSVFGVASEEGLIDGAEGKLGTIEKKYGVDIVLLQGDYDTTITQYGSNTADAVCVTNMDVLAPSLRRKSVAIMPTSTSDGADGVVLANGGDAPLPKFEDADAEFRYVMKGKKVYGLEKSVSEYLVHRLVEKSKMKDDDLTFVNMDPAAAATAVQTKQQAVEAIVVWNPFLLQTLETCKGARVVGDSTAIPMEIVDMVVVAQDALDKPGGKAFATAVADTYYSFNKLLADPKEGDRVLVALGAKFSHLGLNSMRTVVKQTKFFKTPAEGVAVFTSKEFPAVMKRVSAFCLDRKIVDAEPTWSVEAAGTNLLFDTQYMRAVK